MTLEAVRAALEHLRPRLRDDVDHGAAVASVFSVSVFTGLLLVTVMLLALVKVEKLVGASRLEKLPVLLALPGALAVTVMEPPLVTVAVWLPSVT